MSKYCKICDREFFSKQTRDRHVKTFHYGAVDAHLSHFEDRDSSEQELDRGKEETNSESEDELHRGEEETNSESEGELDRGEEETNSESEDETDADSAKEKSDTDEEASANEGIGEQLREIISEALDEKEEIDNEAWEKCQNAVLKAYN